MNMSYWCHFFHWINYWIFVLSIFSCLKFHFITFISIDINGVFLGIQIFISYDYLMPCVVAWHTNRTKIILSCCSPPFNFSNGYLSSTVICDQWPLLLFSIFVLFWFFLSLIFVVAFFCLISFSWDSDTIFFSFSTLSSATFLNCMHRSDCFNGRMTSHKRRMVEVIELIGQIFWR